MVDIRERPIWQEKEEKEERWQEEMMLVVGYGQ